MLKTLIDQPRPVKAAKQGAGMPSSHACLLAYWLATLALRSRAQLSVGSWLALLAVLVLYAAAVVYASVEITYEHSWPQVLAGLGVGAAVAAAWLRVSQELLRLVAARR